ncbi:unnamed protein product [Alopecurus aequalis]
MRSGGSSKRKRKRRGVADPFGALPDEMVNHVLSYLPSREAVKSSLLSRRWRHLWRSTPAIRVTGKGNDFRLFVSSLMCHRDATPLRLFEINADLLIPHEHPYDNDPEFTDDWRGEVDRHLDMWVNLALSAKCCARSLTVRLAELLAPWRPRRPLGVFASPHLTRIHLEAVHLVDAQLDFSCCPALLRLSLVRCRLEGDALVSPSLERLAIDDCNSEIGGCPEMPDEMLHTSLSTASLRFLELSKNYDARQFLEMMPWLTGDNIRYTDDNDTEYYSRMDGEG